MVHLTEENDFILLEGDEYLSSALDRRPKFHLYQPNIALISGIAWDHINVFPTFENYVEQFELFLDSMTNGSTLVYNEEDDILTQLAINAKPPTRKHAYSTPEHSIDDAISYLETPEGKLPVDVFGKHNLQNIAGAKWICQHMGVDQDDFYEAITNFKGASKRLEKIAESNKAIVFKDYAHSPSKVLATTKAVKAQFSSKIVLACLELHTYSSLNSEFLNEYKEALNAADEAVVFYSPKALEIKQLKAITEEQIFEAFGRKDLKIFTNPEDFREFLKSKSYLDQVLLLMSSGNYGGLDFEEIKNWIQ
jgi:UDP-N-acetylmuramate: L-alanyl-gamma-D-glutamyl-meso-diaminopimelate ligase